MDLRVITFMLSSNSKIYIVNIPHLLLLTDHKRDFKIIGSQCPYQLGVGESRFWGHLVTSFNGLECQVFPLGVLLGGVTCTGAPLCEVLPASL